MSVKTFGGMFSHRVIFFVDMKTFKEAFVHETIFYCKCENDILKVFIFKGKMIVMGNIF